MDEYSFLFLNHGEIDTHSVGKNEECYIWFSRPLSDNEREEIVERCPPPLTGIFAWGDRFAYFGSGGDTYDFDILACYGGAAWRALERRLMAEEGLDEEEYAPYIEDRSGEAPAIDIAEIDDKDIEQAIDDLKNICVSRFTQDLEAWSRHVNALVPIVVLKGPAGTSRDDPWHVYSHSCLHEALDDVVEHMRVNPWLYSLAKLSEGDHDEDDEDDDGLGHDWRMVQVPRRDQARYFGYLFCDLVRRVAADPSSRYRSSAGRQQLLDIIEIVYALDGIFEPVSQLSHSEGLLQSNSSLILRALEGLPPDRREQAIRAFSPYVQLAYLASYNAQDAGDLELFDDLGQHLATLAEAIPPDRDCVITSLVSMIAHNLIHASAAYREPSKDDASRAAPLFSYICGRADATEEDYINGTVCCEWAQRYPEGLEIATAGLERFPRSRPLFDNAISIANIGGDNERARTWGEMSASLRDAPDETAALNQSYRLVQEGDLAAAQTVLEEYFAGGGARTPRVLTNLCYLYTHHGPPADGDIEELERSVSPLVRTQAEYQDVQLLENYLGLISSSLFGETVDLFEHLVEHGVYLSPSCWINYMYAAHFSNDVVCVHAVDVVEQELSANEAHLAENPMTFANLAALYCRMGDKAKALENLRRSKLHGYHNFHTLRRDEDLKLLWGRDDFESLFAT